MTVCAILIYFHFSFSVAFVSEEIYTKHIHQYKFRKYFSSVFLILLLIKKMKNNEQTFFHRFVVSKVNRNTVAYTTQFYLFYFVSML